MSQFIRQANKTPYHKTTTNPNDPNADRFLNLIRASRRGKFRVYVGLSADKSYLRVSLCCSPFYHESTN